MAEEIIVSGSIVHQTIHDIEGVDENPPFTNPNG